MYSCESILADRENRSNAIKAAAKKSDVVTVKANVPGADKRIKESFLLVRHFTALALEKFGGDASLYGGADGLCAIIRVFGKNLKQTAVEIEQSVPAGRFIDVDVFLKGESCSLSRGYMRKCFICGNPAFVCARLKTHTESELLAALKSVTREYFSIQVCKTVKESLMAELNLEDKFGLVSPISQGSHDDLDYGLMVKAQDAIIPYLAELFWAGFDAPQAAGLLKKLRPIGIKAEKAMYAAVGVNAYKGFIFVGGIILASTGFLVARGGGKFGEIFAIVGDVCRGITAELEENGETFGIKAYKTYKITGVRGHAENGFKAVEKAEKAVGDLSPLNLTKALCGIVGEIDDTVLLKRSRSYEKYLYFKKKISGLNPSDKNSLNSLNRECVENHISVGGSADVLAAAVMLKKFRKLIYFDP